MLSVILREIGAINQFWKQTKLLESPLNIAPIMPKIMCEDGAACTHPSLG